MPANVPQLFITITYYYYNSTLTSMLAAAEYSPYGATCKPLRITWPVKNSQQRSTYLLSVPYQYGISLLVTCIILHWLVSQSMFHVLVIPYNMLEHPDHKSKRQLDKLFASIFLALLVGAVRTPPRCENWNSILYKSSESPDCKAARWICFQSRNALSGR